MDKAWSALGKIVTARETFVRFLDRVDGRAKLLQGDKGPHVRKLLDLLSDKDFDLPGSDLIGGLTRRQDVSAGYLDGRKKDRREVSTYLTEARRRAESGDVSGAVCALSSVIEEHPGRGDALRLVGYRLLDLKQPEQAARLFEQVLRQRPFELHSYRDLARSLEESRLYALVAVYYEIVMSGTWNNRFHGELALVAREEYVRMMQEAVRTKAVSKAVADHFGERLEKLSEAQKPADLRVTISWNTDATDIDLWVIEPNGEKCFYQHNRTKSGGELSADQTQGYGPERYQVQKASGGTYTVLVHYFKNLETPSKMERVAGIQTGGSERAFDVFMKARYLHERHPGHGVTFATGTPISNTMVEMYTMSRYLDPEGLKSRGLEHYDAWAATFGEVIDVMEIAPDGKSLRPRSRFARFTNLPELQQMFRAFADVQTAEMLDLPCPRLESGKPIVVACPMSDEQHALQRDLVERYERLRSQKVDPREDNALAITTDGRKLATDGRMLSATAPDFADSKINALVEKVAIIWERTATTRGTQMIFGDIGVHPTPWGFSARDDIVTKLVGRGIPRAQIAAVGDADSDGKKQVLFEQVRSGQVRVLLGSTMKMGTGTNVQKRLAALHHLDAPWKPAEVEQREGRILRQGNQNEEVAVYRYVTEGSFDAYMWQALETKARFITQIMTGDTAVRRAEDIGGQELSYAEVKAIASGNPAVLTLAQADAELQRLTLLKKNHLDEQYVARRNVRNLPTTIAGLTERLTHLTTDQTTATTHSRDPLSIGNRVCPLESAPAALDRLLETLPWNVREIRRFPLGVYRGLHFGLVLNPHFPPDVYLEGATTRRSMLSKEHQGPRAVLNAAERLASSYGAECERVQEDLRIAESQFRDYQTRLGKPFLHHPYLSELTALRDELKVRLSGPGPNTNPGPELDTRELARRIKALIENQTTTATAERPGRRHVSAEEPIALRIRRRTENTDDPVQNAEAG